MALRFLPAALKLHVRLNVRKTAARKLLSAEGLERRSLLASISGITLINSDTDAPVGGTIANNGTITVDLKTTRRINFRADATEARSVKFGYDGQPNYKIEGGAPYAFASNSGADYLSFTPSVGTHTVTATAYSGDAAGGTASATYKINVKVVDTTRMTTGTTTPPVTGSSAHLGTPPSLPAQAVLFANFDNGGEGIAFHDTDATNTLGSSYRTGGVDIEANTDVIPSNLQSQSGAQKNVGSVRAGEWWKYTVNVTAAGTYTLGLRYASGNPGGMLHIEVDGKQIGSTTLTNSGGWHSWKTVEKAGFILPAGTHVLRFFIDSSIGGGDVATLNWFRFTAANTSPPSSAPVAWPTGWSSTTSAPSKRFESAAHSFDGKLYSFGGFKNSHFDVDRTYVSFDPNTMKWTKLGTLPVGMAETHLGVADDGHYIYFVGGFGGDYRHGQNPPQTASKSVWRFEPSTNEWKQLKSLPDARGAGGASVIDGKLHYFGGTLADRVTNTSKHLVLDLSDPDEGWTLLAPMPVGKDHFSTITIGSKIYTLGGEKGHDKLADIQKSVYVYDDTTNAWSQLPDMPFTKQPFRRRHVLDGRADHLRGRAV